MFGSIVDMFAFRRTETPSPCAGWTETLIRHTPVRTWSHRLSDLFARVAPVPRPRRPALRAGLQIEVVEHRILLTEVPTLTYELSSQVDWTVGEWKTVHCNPEEDFYRFYDRVMDVPTSLGSTIDKAPVENLSLSGSLYLDSVYGAPKEYFPDLGTSAHDGYITVHYETGSAEGEFEPFVLQDLVLTAGVGAAFEQKILPDDRMAQVDNNDSKISLSLNVPIHAPGTDALEGMFVGATIFNFQVGDSGIDHNVFHEGKNSTKLKFSDNESSIEPGVYEALPLRVGSVVTFESQLSARTIGSPDCQVYKNYIKYGDYNYQAGGRASDSFVLKTYVSTIEVLYAGVSADSQFVDILINSDIAPQIYESGLYWFDLPPEDFDNPDYAQPEMLQALDTAVPAISPAAFQSSIQLANDFAAANPAAYLDIFSQYSSLDAPPLLPEDIIPSDTYIARIPTSLLQASPSPHSRLFVSLDSGNDGWIDGDVYEPPSRRADNFAEIRPDAVIDRFDWTPEGGVEGEYSIRWIRDLNEPLPLNLFWSEDVSWDAADAPAADTLSMQTLVSPGRYPFQFSREDFVDAELSDRYLIAHVDPPPPTVPIRGMLFETNERNNETAREVPDIEVTHAELIDPSDGTLPYLQVDYKISNTSLHRPADLEFFWTDYPLAADTEGRKELIGAVHQQTNIEVGEYQVKINTRDFGGRPEWATYLYLMADDQNLIREYDEENNTIEIEATADIDIQSSSLEWKWGNEATGGGLLFEYRVTGFLSEPVPIRFTWENEDTRRAVQDFQSATVPGTYPVTLSGKAFNALSSLWKDGDRLTATADPENAVDETDELNNRRELPLTLIAPQYTVEVNPDPALRKHVHTVYVVMNSPNPVPVGGYGAFWTDVVPSDPEIPDPEIMVTYGGEYLSGVQSGYVLYPYDAFKMQVGSYIRTWDWIEPPGKTLVDDTIETFEDGLATLIGEIRNNKTLPRAVNVLLLVEDLLEIYNAKYTAQEDVLVAPVNDDFRPVPGPLTKTINLEVALEHKLALAAYYAGSLASGQLLGTAIATVMLPPPVSAPLVALQALASGLFFVGSQLAYNYAADPPDPDYTQNVVPRTPELSIDLSDMSQLERLAFATSAKYYALKVAENEARDKSDGALLAGDAIWVGRQLASASAFADEALVVDLQLQAIQDRLGLLKAVDVNREAIASFVTQYGLPEEFRTIMQDLGVSPERLEAVQQEFSELTPSSVDHEPVDLQLLMLSQSLSSANAAFSGLRQAAQIRIESGTGVLTSIDETTLEEIVQRRSEIDSLLDAEADWSVLYPLVEGFRQFLRNLVEETNDIQAVAEHLDFAYAVTLSLGFRLPSQVEAVVVNDGSSQRSVVRSITVDFDSDVTVSEGAFEVANSQGEQVIVFAAISQVDGKTRAVLTFSGSLVDSSGSLLDGNYQLLVNTTRIADSAGHPVAGDDSLVAGTVRSFTFHRLAGDGDGDRDVDADDVLLFRHSYLKTVSSSLFDAAFDMDGDGDVDMADYLLFRGNYRKRLDG